MRLTIKTPGDVSAFGITLSQNRIGWIALAIGAYLSGTLWLFRSHHAGEPGRRQRARSGERQPSGHAPPQLLSQHAGPVAAAARRKRARLRHLREQRGGVRG